MQPSTTIPPRRNSSFSNTAVPSGSMHWEPLRQRLVSSANLSDSLSAAQELRTALDSVPNTEYPLLLSALLPAVSTVLVTKTRPVASTNSIEYQLRQSLLDFLNKLVTTVPSSQQQTNEDILRPHAPHLVAVAMDVLTRDFEDHSVSASRMLFDLYKTYQTLPTDNVQPYLDFVTALYRHLPVALQQNFHHTALVAVSVSVAPKLTASPSTTAPTTATTMANPTSADADPMDIDASSSSASHAENPSIVDAAPMDIDAPNKPEVKGFPMSDPPPSSLSLSAAFDSSVLSLSTLQTDASTHPQRILLPSNVSFRVLTECPLVIMLMFQLYPQFMKTNIPVLVKVMMESLAQRPPSLQSIAAGMTAATTPRSATDGATKAKTSAVKIDSALSRVYFSRMRELLAAQAKTLSFLTYLLRTFSAELKPYEDLLAANVVALMTNCPRESIATRKELLVATRHLLNSDFRAGFFRHIDPMLDERVLMGTALHSSHGSSSGNRADPTLIRPLAYTTLSDFVQHVRALLTMTQMSRVVCLFSRILHDPSKTLPLTTQYTAVRTLLSVVDLIFQNNDPDGQIGRDMLVRILDTLVDKLQALTDYFPDVLAAERKREAMEQTTVAPLHNTSVMTTAYEATTSPTANSAAWLLLHHHQNNNSNNPPDLLRDVKSMIRAIIVGQKTLIFYISSYRSQRMNLFLKGGGGDASSSHSVSSNRDVHVAPIPPGSNEEVATAMLKITNTEIAIIDRYIVTAISAMKLLTESVADTTAVENNAAMTPTSASANRKPTTSTEKALNEQHRDALTYFAAAFTGLDGYNLRRSLGRRLDLLIDAIVDDPIVMIIPRHLLASNATTSLEFCGILLDWLVARMDLLSSHPHSCLLFVDEQPSGHNDVNERKYVREQLHSVSQLPADSSERLKQQSTTMLQLFERVLKSLSVHPDNEVVVRRHLRRIVVVCLRSSMENLNGWPESYCMLVRYVFRSISAGKFEDSYRALLPLIPTVLNGLYRVVCSSDGDSDLRSTAIELCLTIPARLSSLLPHMNLLLRIIIPALDSKSGDLVNLGLRTLEFWVDNLNPLFLYPEISKQTELFSTLMQSLSHHLRPAPYPYGLLTLRLLGKLGGKNRLFLKDAMRLCEGQRKTSTSEAQVICRWRKHDDAMDDSDSLVFSITLPLGSCVDTLRMIALLDDKWQDYSDNPDSMIHRSNISRLWECKVEDLDTAAYAKDVMDATKSDQAKASLDVILAAIPQDVEDKVNSPGWAERDGKDICMGLLYAMMIENTKSMASVALHELVCQVDQSIVAESLSEFLSEPSTASTIVGLEFMGNLLGSTGVNSSCTESTLFDELVRFLCEVPRSYSWDRQIGPQEALCQLTATLGSAWSRRHEVKLINAALRPVKTIPRELTEAALGALRSFIMICNTLYGTKWSITKGDDALVWDMLCSMDGTPERDTVRRAQGVERFCPSEEVFKITIHESTSPQQLTRFAARFLLSYFAIDSTAEKANVDIAVKHFDFIRRVLFSRSLRLLPLPHQVGVVEGLTATIKQFPTLLQLTDQHLVACLSDLLKMASVADNEMTDDKLSNVVVDKDGFVPSDVDVDASQYPTHASALFFRRTCIVDISGVKVVVPGELPAGVQLRVSTITLLHAIIRTNTDPFFDAETTTPIGNIRPHVISLLFRSLVSSPIKAVNASHDALRDALSLSRSAKLDEDDEATSSQSRLPKELLQTCIRPVLQNLREYTRLSVPLLRGLSRLLSLLSSWFNKTLGEKLLDHLRKWGDPSRIISHKIWKEGEEPIVAASIVSIFVSLPHASQFVEVLVKTCIKLESTLPLFKSRFVQSPYRRPLAQYLNKHAQHAVSFFFPRLKTPMYSELFQYVVQLDDSSALRDYLCNKQCSVMLLNVCFERPLAIIKIDKSSNPGGSTKTSLPMHGISSPSTDSSPDLATTSQRPMNIETLEMQHQGFRLVSTLLANNTTYFRDHSDVVRAFRWLWRSKGRSLRLQHEEMLSPRFHDESKMLALFLMNYVKSSTSDDLDILFELFRVFLQPSTSDFAFVSRFLVRMVTNVLSLEQKRKVMQRFYASIAGDTNEDIKVLGIQFLVFPMVAADCMRHRYRSDDVAQQTNLMDDGVIEKFVNEIIFHEGVPVVFGDRLKVELLRLLYLFVEYSTAQVEPFRTELVKYCWGLLKSEDTQCKCWSYVVVCRFIAAFETPVNIVRQVYTSLLRLNQQESKELVRAALDMLVPALSTRLSDSEFLQFIDQTANAMSDDDSSTSHLAHVGQIVVRFPNIFKSHSVRFVPLLVKSINRLGLAPSGPNENRMLSVSIIELLFCWDFADEAETGRLLPDHVDILSNFLIRLQLLPEVGSPLASKVLDLLKAVLEKWRPAVSSSQLEKCMSNTTKVTGQALACLQLVSALVEFRYHTFLSRHASLVKSIIERATEYARDESMLLHELHTFVPFAKTVNHITSFLLISLERVLDDEIHDHKRPTSDRSSDRSRSTKDRSTAVEETPIVSPFAVRALELIADLCRDNVGSLNAVTSTLLTLAKLLCKAHLSDTAAKQRQGSTNVPRTAPSGIRHHTPTVGILEEEHLRHQANSSKLAKARTKDESLLGPPIRSLILILSMLETSDIVFTFTPNRKSLLLIVVSILENSDCAPLLMITMRCVGKWVLYGGPSAPLTPKEKKSLMLRIAAYDLSNVADDVAAQPLADLVSDMAIRFSANRMNEESKRLAGACLLHPDLSVRKSVQTILLSTRASESEYEEGSSSLLFRALHADFEGMCARFWIVAFVDYLMHPLVAKNDSSVIESMRIVAHGNIPACLQLLEVLLPRAWSEIPDDSIRIRVIASIESLLSKSYHAQLLRAGGSDFATTQSLNSVRSFLNAILLMNPIPVLDTHLLISLAENYNCWYEVVSLLEKQFQVLRSEHAVEATLSAMRHCYRQLGEDDIWRCLARQSCVLAKSKMAISLETYEVAEAAAKAYAKLMTETENGDLDPTDFEMDVWEERWILLQKELCQFEVVSEFASASGSASLQLECAWKSQDWTRVRALCASTALLSAVESGDPILKLSETLLAVADGKLSEVENLHAQTAQLCLYKWQLLPRLSSGSLSHAALLHFFHRLVEIRESGQIMVETSNHSNGRTLPDLKNLLSAWRYRLPNDWESLSMWDEVIAWRAHMFSAITTNFNWCEPDALAAQHDRPWTALRMAKTARKQGMSDVARLLLSKATDEQSMNVSDAYTKLREQILTYFNPESKLERTGGLSLIDATNLSFFDASQTSELFRLKAVFLQSVQSRSKANQAYCHAVQICPTHARAWDSWGELCASLGAVTEKQRDQASGGAGGEVSKDVLKKVRQYLAQAMGCYIEAIQIDAHEWARIRIPKCLWMLAKDGSAPGVLCQTLETRGAYLPAWVWLPWIPQLLTSFYRREGHAIKSIFARLVKAYPQAVYYPLRAFYLERRDVDRVKSSTVSASSTSQQGSVARAEELMSLLRRSHASLWSSLETCLEELIVTFRPSYEEELLATVVVLLERAESQVGNSDRKDDVWKTLGKIAVKFFRRTNGPNVTTRDARMEKTAQFKEAYKDKFESDFQVSSNEQNPDASPDMKSPLDLDDIIAKLCSWKVTLENHVLTYPESMSLIEASHSLAMFGVGDAPDLWPGSCDPSSTGPKLGERETAFDTDTGNTQTSTSSSALAARKAAKSATKSVTEAAMREGVGGEYGGGSSWIEIPGQYCTDVKPSPELHAKLVKFEPFVKILRRSDTLVRRIGMVASDGNTYHFLLQFAVPYLTRTDERNSQVHYILDKVLRKVVRSSRATLSVQSYPVIPVAQRLRLVSEPGGRNSLEDIHKDVCLQRNVDPSELPKLFNDEVKRLLNEKRQDEAEKESGELGRKIRSEVFTKICTSDGVDDMMMTDYLFSLLQGPEPLHQFRNMFARQWAANCLLQFVFSSSERTPAKVVFDCCSGRVLAPEFRIGYTNQGCFESQPTPFRLTPNLATVIGFPLLDARFMTTMATIAGAVQACQQDLDPVFRLLMRDDLVAFYTKSVAKSDSKTAEMEKQLSSSVSRNVATIHMRFSDCAPLTSKISDAANEFTLVDQRVRELVEAAQNAENLCMMPGSFQGWL